MKKIKIPKIMWLILIASLCLHILFLIKQPSPEFNEVIKQYYGAPDAYNYYLSAEQLLEDGVFGYVYLKRYEEPVINAYITPGQPIFLAICLLITKIVHLPLYNFVVLVNMILNILSIFLIYRIGKELFEKESIGIVAALLFSTYISIYHYFRTLLTEPTSIFLFILSVYLFVMAWKYNQTKTHIIFGITVSILLMFRPNPAPVLLIAIFTILFTYGIRSSIKIGLLWLIGPLLIIGPWVLRNAITLHEFVLFSTQSGNPLLAGTDPYNKQGFENIVKEMKKEGFIDQKEYAMYRIKQGFLNDFNYWFSWFTLGKTIELFRIPSMVNYYLNYAFYPFVLFQHYLIIYTGVITSFICSLHTKKHIRLMMLVLTIVTYIAFSNIFLAIDRYGFFIIPLICLVASYGLVFSLQSIKNKIILSENPK